LARDCSLLRSLISFCFGLCEHAASSIFAVYLPDAVSFSCSPCTALLISPLLIPDPSGPASRSAVLIIRYRVRIVSNKLRTALDDVHTCASIAIVFVCVAAHVVGPFGSPLIILPLAISHISHPRIGRWL